MRDFFFSLTPLVPILKDHYYITPLNIIAGRSSTMDIKEKGDL